MRRARCYLFGFNTDGKPQLCYPASEEEPPTPISELDYPPRFDQGYSLTEGPGLQAFVLVVASKPLVSFVAWRRGLDNLAWPREASVGASIEVDTWQYDGEQFVPLDLVRGKVESLAKVPDSFRALCERVRKQPGVEAVRAIAFPVARRDRANSEK